MLLFANFLAPLLIALVCVDDLLGSSLADFMSPQQWHLIRIIPVIGFVGLRALLFRNEI